MSLKIIAATAAGLASFVISCTLPSAFESSVDEMRPSAARDAGGPPAGETRSGLPCDVAALLAERCQACHGEEPKAGASTSLTSWDALQTEHDGKKLVDLVRERIHDEARPMPPSPRLQPAEIAVLDAWIDGGAKRSDASCATSPGGVEPLACDGERTVLKAARPFVMPERGELDQYICFGMDVHHDQKHHLIGFGPKVDNDQILHHILVFQTEEAVDPNPAPCDPTKSIGWTMIGGWAPGGQAKLMPPEAGFPEEAGTTHYAVQLHYNNARGLTGATDQSGMELCSTDTLRPHDAAIVAFGALNFGPKKPIDIPPRKSKHTVTCNYRWLHGDVTFFNASPHMHKRGRSLRSETTSGRVLADQPRFDFEQQIGSHIDVGLKRGEVVKTTCVWANPDDKAVTFGEGTDDEMCFNFLSYYPKVKGVFSWVQPSLASNCTVE